MFLVGAYLRLSKEDGDKETSDSIENQKTLIENFVSKIDNMKIVDFFIDDGYSGLSFDRPGFNRMLREIFKGTINTIITKDMSRLGRDRLETGNYIEKVFPINKIRYISVIDNYDSLTGSNVDIAPFKGLIDEMYAKDISRKVKGAFDAKRIKGDFIGAFAPYGYAKDSNNKNKLVIDVEAASIVKRIFSMYISGVSKQTIARILNSEKVPCPTVYKNSLGINYKNANKLELTRYWTYSTVAKILVNEVYLGNMVQKKSEQIFKTNGKKISHSKDKWIIVRDTHEPIIDKETFDNAQHIASTRTRSMKTERNISIYAGIFRCADCGRTMSKTIYKNVVYYKCGTYKTAGVSHCSAHSIREDLLNRIVIDAIQREAQMSLQDKDIEKLINMADHNDGTDISKKIGALETKLSAINKYKKRSYENYIDGLLSKDEYISYKADYDNDEIALTKAISELKEMSYNLNDKLNQHKEYMRRFIRYIDVHHLTRDLMVELVDSIKIYEDKRIAIKFKFESPFGSGSL